MGLRPLNCQRAFDFETDLQAGGGDSGESWIIVETPSQVVKYQHYSNSNPKHRYSAT